MMRFDPLRDVDQLFSSLGQARLGHTMALDAYRDGDELIVEVDLPGVDRESIALTAERNVLQIQASRAPRRRDGAQVLIAERPMGEVTRTIALGDALDVSRVDASYDAGVLRLRVPVADEARPHRIPVRLGGEAHAVEAAVGDQAEQPARSGAPRAGEHAGDRMAVSA